MTTGDRLKFVRKENKFSFEEAAKQAKVVRSMIQRWEKGESETISTAYLTFIHKLGYSLEWILLGLAPQKRKPEDYSLITDIEDIFVRLQVQEERQRISDKRIMELEKNRNT